MNFRAAHPALAAAALLLVSKPLFAAPLEIAIAGDSTVASHGAETVQRGWGQYLQDFFGNGVVVENFARDGRSTRTFLDQGLWKKLLQTRPNIVLIQFGHNDSHAPDHPEHTDAQGDYKAFLTEFVRESRAQGATPVLVTPVQRRTSVDTLIPYSTAMKEVAAALDVPLIDLHRLSGDLYARLGKEGTAALEKPGDRTHFNAAGARQMAILVEAELVREIPELKAFERKDPRGQGGG